METNGSQKRNTRGMGFIYRRGAIWWVQYWVRGRRIRESSESTKEADARKLLKQRIGEATTGKPVGPDVEKTTFGDLASMLITDYRVNGLRSVARIEDALEHLRGFFGGERIEDEDENQKKRLQRYVGGDRAVTITSDRISEYVAQRQTEEAANATINRELAALKRAFRLGTKARKVALLPEITMLDESSNVREGFIERAGFLKLHEALPADLKDPVTFLWLTGWRVGEMCSLTWASVYSDAIRLRRENSKNKRGRELPLVGELAEVIERAREVRRPDCTFVFHRDGEMIGSFRKSWATACKAAGVAGLLVHDLRRSALRNLIRSGVSQKVAMQISGHRTGNVFDRYDITTPQDIAAALERRDEHLAAQPTKPKVVALSAARSGEQPQNSHNAATRTDR
jgi:integrase